MEIFIGEASIPDQVSATAATAAGIRTLDGFPNHGIGIGSVTSGNKISKYQMFIGQFPADIE